MTKYIHIIMFDSPESDVLFTTKKQARAIIERPITTAETISRIFLPNLELHLQIVTYRALTCLSTSSMETMTKTNCVRQTRMLQV